MLNKIPDIMHPTAFIACQLFFSMLNDIYVEDGGFCLAPTTSLKILDVGSCDVNGNLRSSIQQSRFRSRNYEYLGIDISEGPNVDLVYNNTQWPFQQYSQGASPDYISSQLFDIIISSSCFEHDDFFWETFLNIADSLNPGGFIFINVPSSGMVHRFPVDNWRLYSDSAYALAKWANRHGHHLHVIHTSTIPCCNSPYNVNCDTNMIFWKPYYPPTSTPSDIDSFNGEDSHCLGLPEVHSALQSEEQLQKFFKLFRADVISRLNSYVMHTTQKTDDLIAMPDEDERHLSELVDPDARPYRTLFP